MQYTKLPVGQLRANAFILFMPERDDAIVIDPGAEPEKIREALGRRKLRGIVLTHGHVDHIGGVRALRGKDTPVYIHKGDATMLTNPALSMASSFDDAAASQGEADILLDEGGLDIAGIHLDVLHTPGHTPGSVCLRVDDDMFTGDTLFEGAYGRVDLPGGDMRQMGQSLKRLLSLEKDIAIHPGHGDSSTIGAEMRRYRL